MYLTRSRPQLLAQPQGAPEIDRGNPLTHGLVGLLWLGPGKRRDLLNPKVPGQTQTGVWSPTTRGVATVATTAQIGYDSGYSGVQPALAPWKLAVKPVTFLAFFDSVGYGGSSNFFAAVTHGSSGLQVWNTYGANVRRVQVYSAAGVSANIESGSWAAGAHVRGLTHDGATLIGYDSGRAFGSTADATSAIYYDASFTTVRMLNNTGGTGYWMALWNRVLTPAAVAALNANPWQLLAGPVQRVFAPAAAAGPVTPILSQALAVNVTSSSATPRVTVTV